MKNKPLNYIYPSFLITIEDTFTIEKMKELDYYTVHKFQIPVELMMENAGYHLARLITKINYDKNKKILFGIGNGNNGGGGLVAARRLAGWGYNVYLDIPLEITSDLTKQQLDRAINFGCEEKYIENPDYFIDAYFGFSQRLPLPEIINNRIQDIRQMECFKIALDIPTGITEESIALYIKPNIIATLAAPKKVLFQNGLRSDILLIDIGIPKEVLSKFGLALTIPFNKSQVYKLEFNNEENESKR